MKQLLLSISYDGTDFHGWQRQPTARTVQQVLEEKLHCLTGEEISLTGCSRTDAGVHALAQQATFYTKGHIPVERIPIALNNKLPRDIYITACQEVPPEFHPRYDVVGKRYGYSINTNDKIDIRQRRYCWHLTERLNVSEMQKAALHLIGKHDFAAFCAAGSQVHSTVRTIYAAELTQPSKDEIYFHICGDGFLYKMVRIIVGSLVDIGNEKYNADYLLQVIESRCRALATRTAPPEGLCLEKVWYDTEKDNINLT